MSFFEDTAFPWVESREGELSLDENDPGNWTGGRVGVGKLVGTKYGVSAAAYPDLDIPNLTYADAAVLAKNRYWKQIQGDQLAPAVALCVFDFAYNSGVHEASKVLQSVLGTVVDGSIGAETIQAASCLDPQSLAGSFTDARIIAYEGMLNYYRYGNGWVARAKATLAKSRTL